jgi:hypothetical protein
MANENQNANQRSQQDQVAAAKILLDFAKEKLDLEGDFRDIMKESISDLKKTLKLTKDINASIGTRNELSINTKDIQNEIKKTSVDQFKNQVKSAELSKNISNVDKERVKIYLKEVEKLQSIEQDRLNINRTISDEVLKDQLNNQMGIVNNLNENLTLLESVYAQTLANEKLNSKTLEILNKELAIEKKVEKTIGSAGAIAKILGQNIQVGTEAHEAMVESARKGYSSSRVMLIGFKTAIKEGLQDPLISVGMIAKANDAIFSGIGKAFSFVKGIAEKIFGLITGWNDRIFEFGKNLGVGEQDAKSMMNHFQSMALNSGPLFLNMTGISKAFSDMSESLGFIAPMNDEMLQTATLLQRQFGLTAADLEAINANSALSGKSFKDTFDTIDAIRSIEGGRNKVMMSQKQMMGEISKVSATVLMNFKGNVPALAEAVVRAKKLGLALNDVQGTTDQFLDFEGSISKEFEAQLFSGEDLNLQQIRRLALVHDTKGMMEEIGKRIPTLDKWNEKNTFDQEATAAAMGLTVDKVSEIIQKQQIVNKLGVQGAETGSEMFLALQKQGLSYDQIVDKMKEAGAQQYLTSSITDKIGTFIDNIKMTLGKMLEGELGQTINHFLSMMNNGKLISEYIEKVRTSFSGIWGFIKELPKTMEHILNIAEIVLKVIAAIEIGLGTAMLFNPATMLQGAALIAGGLKMGAAGYAVGKLGDVAHEMISVSPAAANNQVDSTNSGAASTTGAANQGTQPLNVYMNPAFTVDGQPLHVQTIKNAQSSGPVDNSSGAWFHVHNYSISGGK